MQKTILFLATNPNDTQRLSLGKEIREVENGLQRAKRREEFILKHKWAVRSVDIRRAILDDKPNIVHFCGHGKGQKGIVIEDENGCAKLVSNEALAGLFQLFTDVIDCVVLNACYSAAQAESIVKHIKYVVGMKQAISDIAAIEFAVAFYDALGAGESFDFAYKFGCNALRMAGISGHRIPVLLKQKLIKSSHKIKKSSKRQFRLIAFDLDGTLLRGFDFSWRLVWAYLGYPDKLRKIGMKRYLLGEISYSEWGKWCCNFFMQRGLKKEDFKNITKNITVTKNFYETVKILKREGFVLAIISGGIDVFIEEKISDAYQIFNYIYINTLIFDEHDRLKGIIATEFDFESKEDGINKICQAEGINLDECIFIGEGFNDTFVFKHVGKSIAYPAISQEINEVADLIINEDDLSLILPHVLI